MEVTPRSSGFPGETGSRRLGTLSIPSVVPEETLKGNVGPNLMAGDESQSNFTIPALTEYVGDSERDRLLCPVRAIREYLRQTKNYCPRCSCLFVMVSEPRCMVHPHTISHRICQVIQRAHGDVSEEDMCLVWVKVHGVRAVVTSALFKKIQSIPAILWIGIWKSMSTFASFYLRDITHQYLDTFSLGPVVSPLRDTPSPEEIISEIFGFNYRMAFTYIRGSQPFTR
ncbi:hypothetical protein E2C01_049769 [Portunus trituberculatus]|uniref:Uncharacterized protein n=1 Tax=Portunus trituberculatus TaxID=210409 RepID=A0A5B7GGZ8_PORTR|nr:hypothetical protein [Portunus trituberculatus]